MIVTVLVCLYLNKFESDHQASQFVLVAAIHVINITSLAFLIYGAHETKSFGIVAYLYINFGWFVVAAAMCLYLSHTAAYCYNIEEIAPTVGHCLSPGIVLAVFITINVVLYPLMLTSWLKIRRADRARQNFFSFCGDVMVSKEDTVT